MKGYTKTDQHIHQISQILAKLGRSLVPRMDDDSHTNLYWEPFKKRILGRWIKTPRGLLLPALNLEHTKFEWLDKQMEVITEVSLLHRNYFEAESLVEELSSDVGIEKKDLMAPLHFEIPDYSFKNIPIIEVEQQELSEWSYYRSLANHVLKDVGEHVQRDVEVRIWPHQFDTGIYYQWNNILGIGSGLAMEDDSAGAPYFYISAYPGHDQIDYTKASTLSNGKWIKEGSWKGGILPINELIPESAMQTLEVFYRQALTFLLNQ